MARTEPTRMPELMSRDRAALDAFLDSVVLAHVGLVGDDGVPVVIPTVLARWGDRVVIHGSTGSRWMRRAATGVPVSVSLAAIDGVVVARSAFESSLMYSSAVLFGSLAELEGQEKGDALDVLTERLIPGRTAEVRRPTVKELAATLLLAMPISQWSLRLSDGWPEDDPADVAGLAWGGQVRFDPGPRRIEAAPDLRPGIPVPPSVHAISGVR